MTGGSCPFWITPAIRGRHTCRTSSEPRQMRGPHNLCSSFESPAWRSRRHEAHRRADLISHEPHVVLTSRSISDAGSDASRVNIARVDQTSCVDTCSSRDAALCVFHSKIIGSYSVSSSDISSLNRGRFSPSAQWPAKLKRCFFTFTWNASSGFFSGNECPRSASVNALCIEYFWA